MPEASQFDIKTEIKKYLKKDPRRVESALDQHLSDASSLTAAKAKLSQIQDLQQQLSDKDTHRKTLSRQIGPARKQNLDCQDLISEVSALSEQIKTIEAKRATTIDEVAALCASADDNNQSGSSSPRHFIAAPAQQNTKEDELLLTTETGGNDWQKFVQSCSHATVYHDARWHALIERNFTHQTLPLVCRSQDGTILGVMSLTHLSSKIFGSFTISMPYFNYGGPLAGTEAVEQKLMQYGAEQSKRLGCSHMEIRETRLRSDWPSSQKKVSMVLRLPQDDEALNKQLGSKLRAQVKRAASHEMTTLTGSTELLNEFYAVYSRNMRDLGTPAYGKHFFADILKTFPQESFITVVRKDNQALAAGFLIGYNDKLEIPWASSLRKHNHLGANMFLYRSILSEAISRNYEYFDFGRSTKEANTYKFKKQWGAEEYPLSWHYWTESGELPEINPDNPKYKLVIAVWKRIPVFITRIIGPLIARNLP